MYREINLTKRKVKITGLELYFQKQLTAELIKQITNSNISAQEYWNKKA